MAAPDPGSELATSVSLPPFDGVSNGPSRLCLDREELLFAPIMCLKELTIELSIDFLLRTGAAEFEDPGRMTD